MFFFQVHCSPFFCKFFEVVSHTYFFLECLAWFYWLMIFLSLIYFILYLYYGYLYFICYLYSTYMHYICSVCHTYMHYICCIYFTYIYYICYQYYIFDSLLIYTYILCKYSFLHLHITVVFNEHRVLTRNLVLYISYVFFPFRRITEISYLKKIVQLMRIYVCGW